MPIPSSKPQTLDSRLGFSLIDVMLTLFLVVIFTSILLVGSGSYLTSRRVTLQGLAAEAASGQIDNLRHIAKTDFSSLASGTCSNFNDQNFSKLPSPRTCNQTVSDYNGNTDIKLVSVTVSWTENNTFRNVKFETLIYENGLL